MHFIGDVHARFFPEYRDILAEHPLTIQVGDMGLGFKIPKNRDHLFKGDFDHRFIRGNHDNPEVCAQQLGVYLGDYGYIARWGIYFVSGAWSIDWKDRCPEIDWWENEELSERQFGMVYADYCLIRPDYMVTHDCPQSIYPHLNIHDGRGTRTSLWLDRFLEKHQPKIWIFGHHHQRKTIIEQGTRFEALGTLDVLEIPEIIDQEERLINNLIKGP